MASLQYGDIYSYFLGYITDYKLANMDEDSANELMLEYLRKTISDPYVRRLFLTLTMNDEEQLIDFDLSYKTNASSDNDFVQVILAKGMVIEWLQSHVKSRLNTAQMFAGKEQKFYSQSQHISELRGLLDDARLEQRKMIRDRGYINNPYLNES